MSHTTRAVLDTAFHSIPRLDAEILLAHTLKKDKIYLLSHPDAPVSLWQSFRFRRLVKQRQRGLPVAYLTGHKEFFGLDFLVNTHTLVPRPETETLVALAKEQIARNKEQTILIDVGTGSGCIPIAIMKTSKHKNIKTYAIDISRGALRMAKKNAEKHGTDINFLHGDLLTPITNNLTMEQWNNGTIIITANLPYLTAEQFKEEPSIQHEPCSALVAADGGLAFYKKLLAQISQLFIVHCSLFLEIDHSQSAAITSHIREFFPTASVEIKKDLAGQHRVAMVRL